MLQFAPTFIWTLVNILVLFFVLRKILFGRVTVFMEMRTQSIKDAIESADKKNAEALELKQIYEDQVRSAREDADKIMGDARGRAGREYDAIVSQARTDAEGLLSRAREEIERERAQMLKDVKNQVVVLALSAASKVIEANMDNERNRSLVENFINEEGAV